MFRLIKIFVLALLLPILANAGFHSGNVEEHKRLSKLIIQWGEIIHSSTLKDFKGNEIGASVIYYLRINKTSKRMKLQAIPEGIYLGIAGLDLNDKTIMDCKIL